MTGCQHGENECQHNKVHGCALEYLPREIANAFIFCTMSSDHPPDAIANCSQALIPNEYDYTELIEDCSKGFAGDLILALKGLMSLDFVLDGVPAVAVNGVLMEENDIYDNFLGVICDRILRNTMDFESQQDDGNGTRPTGFSVPKCCLKHLSFDESNSENKTTAGNAATD